MASRHLAAFAAALLLAGPGSAEEQRMKGIEGIPPQKLAALEELQRRAREEPGHDLAVRLGALLSRSEALALALSGHGLANQAFGLVEKDAANLDAADQEKLLALIATAGAGEGHRRTSAMLLGRSAAGVARLQELMVKSGDPTAAVMAAAGLAHPGSKADAKVRRAASEVILEALGHDGDSARLANNSMPAMEEWMVRWLLDRVTRPDAPKTLVDYGLSLIGAQPATTLRAEKAAAFRAGLKRPSVNARIASVNGLRSLGLTKADLPLYAEVAKDPEPHVRRMLWAGLSDSAKPWAAALLTDGLGDSLEENRASCADGLGQLKHRPALPRLVALVAKGLEAKAGFGDDQRAAGAAIAAITKLKGVDFGHVAECRPLGPGVHATVVVDRDSIYRESAAKVLAWWASTGKKEFPNP